MRTLLKYILPVFIIDLYKINKQKRRLKERSLLLKNNNIVTEQIIIDSLSNVGITHNDTIMLHSSLSKIGFVEDGATTIINAFTKQLASSGTLMMPAFPAIGFNYDYLITNPVFDVNHTPSKMGIISETFRNKEGVLRSLHSTDSVCVFGKHADYLTQNHFNQLTPYNSNSPFYKLCQLKGKIILIGVDLSSLTNLHTLEDAITDFKYPVYHQTLFTCSVIDKDGVKKTMQTKVHNPLYSKKRRCNDLLPHFEKAEFVTHFKIGLANCILIDAYQMHEWMVSNYYSKGITMYTPNENEIVKF